MVSVPGTLRSPVPLTTTESTAAVTVGQIGIGNGQCATVGQTGIGFGQCRVSGPPVITGASLVPVIVTVTVSVSLSGVPSSSVALTV